VFELPALEGPVTEAGAPDRSVEAARGATERGA
jgi:hypothetical protein